MPFRREQLTLEELEPAPWGGGEWRVTVCLPDGYGGNDELVLKLSSTKGLGGWGSLKPRDGGDTIHVFSGDSRGWYGELRSTEIEPALEELLPWLDGKALGIELLALAPIEQFVTVVDRFRQSLDLSSNADPQQAWDDLLSLAMEINARMGRDG